MPTFKLFIQRDKLWPAGPGPALVIAGPDWKQSCGAPLSGVCRNVWGASSDNVRNWWCVTARSERDVLPLHQLAVLLKLSSCAPPFSFLGKTSVEIVGDPPRAKESLAFRLITLGHLTGAVTIETAITIETHFVASTKTWPAKYETLINATENSFKT